MGKRSALESMLAFQLRGLDVVPPAEEYRFAAAHVGLGPGVRTRLRSAGLKNWAFDFAWPALMFAVEVEGGAFSGGRHTRGAGFTEDCLKYHHAMRLGWSVYRCDVKLVRNGEAARLIMDIVDQLRG